MHLALFLIFFLTSCYQAFAECQSDKSQITTIRLKNDLLCGYDNTVRPVVNQQNSTKVRMRMVVKYFTYDEHSGTFSIDSWLTMHWRDEHLRWRVEDYDNIKFTHLKTDLIWTPDISVYNRNDQSGSPAAFDSATCIVTYGGLVVCVPPTRQNSLCVPDLTRYPFDTQNCTVRFGSWVYSGEEIDFGFDTPAMNVGDMVPNGQWKLMDTKVVKHPGKFKCCPNNTYPSINYSFKIKRLTGPHAATIILPAITLIVVTLTSLCLDPSRSDRLILCYVNLICQLLYLEDVHWTIPTTGEKIPLIMLFARDSLILCAFTIPFSVFLKKLAEKRNSAVPFWISGGISVLINNRVGQFIFLRDSSLKGVASARGEEDGANIIDGKSSDLNENNSHDWAILAKILDFLCFVSYCIVYFCMFIAFTP